MAGTKAGTVSAGMSIAGTMFGTVTADRAGARCGGYACLSLGGSLLLLTSP